MIEKSIFKLCYFQHVCSNLSFGDKNHFLFATFSSKTHIFITTTVFSKFNLFAKMFAIFVCNLIKNKKCQKTTKNE